MKKMNLYVFFLAVISIALADELSDCKCIEGYRPKQDADGVVMCYGIHVKAIAPCNMVKKPRCKCGPEATGILNDATGTWCSTYNKGRITKRWECENRDEWKTFFEQHTNLRRMETPNVN